MKLFITMVLVLIALPCAAAPLGPAIALDGNGNPVANLVYGTTIVSDSGHRTIDGTVDVAVSGGISIDSVSISVPTYITNADASGTVAVTGTSLNVHQTNQDTDVNITNTSLAVTGTFFQDVQPCTIPASTLTNLAFDTAIAASTFDTFTLDASYDWIYVSSDTDIIVALTAAEVLAGIGDVQNAGMTTPYNYRTSEVYIRNKSGLASSGQMYAVRGMR